MGGDLSGDLAAAVLSGDLERARRMVSRGGRLPHERALLCCVESDSPGMARMLACEGVIDAGAVDCDADCDGRVMGTEHVAAELLTVGMKVTPRTRTEAALWHALADSRCSTAAAAVMMRAAVDAPKTYAAMLDVAGESPTGKEMLARVAGMALLVSGAEEDVHSARGEDDDNKHGPVDGHAH